MTFFPSTLFSERKMQEEIATKVAVVCSSTMPIRKDTEGYSSNTLKACDNQANYHQTSRD